VIKGTSYDIHTAKIGEFEPTDGKPYVRWMWPEFEETISKTT